MSKAMNLIPMPRLAARQRLVWRGRCVITCMGYAAIIASVTVVARAVIGHTDAEVPGLLEASAGEIDRSGKALESVRAELDTTESLLYSSRAIAEQPDWCALLGLLAARADGEIVLKAVTVRPREIPTYAAAAKAPAPSRGPTKAAAGPDPTIIVSISGAGRSQAAASQYALRLEATGLFGRVSLQDTSRETFAELPLVSFRIECTLSEPGTKPMALPAPHLRADVSESLSPGGEP